MSYFSPGFSCHYDYLIIPSSFYSRAKILTADMSDDYEMEKKPAVPSTVQEDRKYLIDAAIVRVMKLIKKLPVPLTISHLW